MRKRRVVLTGIGPVSSIGIGKHDFFKNILEYKPAVSKIPKEFEINYTFKSRYYSPLAEISLSEYGFPAYYDNLTQMKDKIAILGTRLALTDAGYTISKADKNFKIKEFSDCSVIFGIGFSGLETALNSYLAHLNIKSEDNEALRETKIRYNRMIIPSMMPNSASAWVSIIFNLNKSNYTINASCASGTYAVGEAYRKIENGSDDLILAGGIEYLHDKFGCSMRGFDMLDALTKAGDGLPRPFSNERSGFLFSEGGGCIIVLEELQHALERGARIYAELSDFRSNSDACNIIQIDPSGSQVIKLLKELKEDNKIDYFNTHGTGTQTNDEVEANAIREVFGEKQTQPYINSTKGILGHTIGASGALEIAVIALSIKQSRIHGNNISSPMKDLNLVDKTIDAEIDNALSVSYGFGGHNAGIMLRKFEA